jgi:hypothetical protein
MEATTAAEDGPYHGDADDPPALARLQVDRVDPPGFRRGRSRGVAQRYGHWPSIGRVGKAWIHSSHPGAGRLEGASVDLAAEPADLVPETPILPIAFTKSSIARVETPWT